MITIIGEDSGGVFGGKRGILSTKRLPSLPLRIYFYNYLFGLDKHRNSGIFLLIRHKVVSGNNQRRFL